jgi:hypothetical protein
MMSNYIMMGFAIAAVAGMAYRWDNPGKPRMDAVRHITLEFRP